MESSTKSIRLKVDFNLLQSGTWVLEKKGNQQIHYFEKEVGNGKIIIYNALDVPSPFDSKLLDYLMKLSQENDWSQEIIIPTITQVLKDLGLGKRKQTVDRIKKSLKILKNTHIEFHNCFIDNGILEYFEEGTWELVSIGIIEEYGFRKTKGRGNPLRVRVKFTNSFISLCKHSLGYKLIPYAPIQGLRDTAYALYKWAWRWFNTEKNYGERWIGNEKSLIKWYRNELNSTGRYKYPSEVLRRIKSAIKQLNENPRVPFYLQLKEENGKYKIEIHLKSQCTLKREIPFDQLPGFFKRIVISLIKRKKHIREPFALARSMSWKELEELLEDVIVVPVPKNIWEFITNDIIAKAHNEDEKREFKETVLGVENKGQDVLVAFESSRLKKKSLISTLLDAFIPNWRSSLSEAKGYIKGLRATKT